MEREKKVLYIRKRHFTLGHIKNLIKLNKKLIYLLVIGFLITAITLTIFLANQKELRDSRSRADLSQDVTSLTQSLLERKGPESSRIRMAIQRKAMMQNLAQVNPDDFLLNALDTKGITLMSNEVKQHIEKEITTDGYFIEKINESLNEDGSITEQPSTMLFQNYDTAGNILTNYKVYFPTDLSPVFDRKVKIKGYLLNDLLIPQEIIDTTTSRGLSISSASLLANDSLLATSAISKGDKKLAVIMVNSSSYDEPLSGRGKFTPEDMTDIYFGDSSKSVANYIKEATLDNLRIIGSINDVYGWITINVPRDDGANSLCNEYNQNAFNKMKNAIKNDSRYAGRNIDDYDFYAIILQYRYVAETAPYCRYRAIARGIPGIHSSAKPMHYLNGDIYGYKRDESLSSWEKDYYGGILSHEVGHNIGLSHAQGLDCGSEKTIKRNLNDCQRRVYMDSYDIIGSAWDYYPSISANNLYKLGYIKSPGNVKTVNSSGNYKLYSSSIKRPEGQTQLIRIKRNNSTNSPVYNIELRSKNNLDGSLNPNSIFNGPLIRISNIPSAYFPDRETVRFGNPAETHLLDMTPNDRVSNNGPGVRMGFAKDPAFNLTTRNTFIDEAANITIKNLAVNKDLGEADLEITFGQAACERKNPTISFVSRTQTGDPGQTLSYTMKIRNNNTSCASTSYNISASDIPTDWINSLSSNSININSGEQQNITITLKSAENATGGTYRPTYTATDSSSSSLTASKKLTYNIVTPDPTPTLSPSPTPEVTPPPQPTGTITASPMSCIIPSDRNSCIVTVSWNTENATDVSVSVSGSGSWQNGSSGSQATGIPVGNTTFTLYSGSIELGRVTVTGVKAAPPTPTAPVKLTAKLSPTNDSYTSVSYPNNNYGRSNALWADGEPDKRLFFKFDLRFLSGKKINSIKLKLTVADIKNAGSPGIFGIRITDNNWNESTITWGNRPDAGETKIATISNPHKGGVIYVDLKNQLSPKKGQVVSLRIGSDNSNGAAFYSKEAPSGKPQLIIEYQ